MNKYIKVAVSYKFKPEGEVYKQAHYRAVTPEEDVELRFLQQITLDGRVS
ncbi:hypothetical protein [Bacillus thuringiensis]